MKLIIHYYSGDNEEGSDFLFPFEYESKEKAEYDFLSIAQEALKNKSNFNFCFKCFKFLNLEFYLYDFFDNRGKYKEPSFYTLDEWFEKERIDK